jgi:hypothetical protein
MPHALAARLELPATTAAPGGPLRYRVTNTGAVPILLGASYGLERLVAHGWEEVSVPYSFPAWGVRLESERRRELTARIPERVQSGRHRLRVRMRADRDPHPGFEWVALEQIQPIEVCAEFDVVRGQ